MFPESISDDSLADIYHGGIIPSMPNDVHSAQSTKMFVVQIDLVQHARNTGATPHPLQLHREPPT